MTWAAFSKGAFKAALEWGIQPGEFWNMSPREWWWAFDAKVALAKKMKAETGKLGSADAWEKARAIHREKMKNGAAPS